MQVGELQDGVSPVPEVSADSRPPGPVTERVIRPLDEAVQVGLSSSSAKWLVMLSPSAQVLLSCLTCSVERASLPAASRYRTVRRSAVLSLLTRSLA
ncbi:hypothetical protein SMICM304S_05904 [Streptomyces microflavus]